jgi:hypothetical protein
MYGQWASRSTSVWRQSLLLSPSPSVVHRSGECCLRNVGPGHIYDTHGCMVRTRRTTLRWYGKILHWCPLTRHLITLILHQTAHLALPLHVQVATSHGNVSSRTSSVALFIIIYARETRTARRSIVLHEWTAENSVVT